jgi:hypothetical protein
MFLLEPLTFHTLPADAPHAPPEQPRQRLQNGRRSGNPPRDTAKAQIYPLTEPCQIGGDQRL